MPTTLITPSIEWLISLGKVSIDFEMELRIRNKASVI